MHESFYGWSLKCRYLTTIYLKISNHILLKGLLFGVEEAVLRFLGLLMPLGPLVFFQSLVVSFNEFAVGVNAP